MKSYYSIYQKSTGEMIFGQYENYSNTKKWLDEKIKNDNQLKENDFRIIKDNEIGTFKTDFSTTLECENCQENVEMWYKLEYLQDISEDTILNDFMDYHYKDCITNNLL